MWCGDLSQPHAMQSGALNGSGGFAGGGWYEPKGALILNGSTHLRAPYVAAAMITVNGGTSLSATSS
jgi:hypothetical protein